MKKPVVLVGVGEMGGVFARGLLRAGYSVCPLLRGEPIEELKEKVSDPQAVVIGVGEKDLQAVLQAVPAQWYDRVVLLQNELLPNDWKQHGIANPTVISVWFEKKPGQDVKVIIPSPVFGPKAELIREALSVVKIPVRVLNSEDELLTELVLKNLYIVTTNVSGLVIGGTVGELWSKHRKLCEEVAGEVLDIQFALINRELDRQQLISGMEKAFNGDTEHKCMGRSAPARLARAIEQAEKHNIEAVKLHEISEAQKANS